MAITKSPGESWERLINNRSFVGEFIANPEATLAKYHLSMKENDFLALARISDKLFEHASETFHNEKTRLLDCPNNCVLNCTI